MDPKNKPEKTESSESESERPRIERDFAQARQIGWANGHQKTQSRRRDADGHTPPKRPSSDALDQQFARDAHAAGAERGANGELLLARTRRAPAADWRRWCRRSA